MLQERRKWCDVAVVHSERRYYLPEEATRDAVIDS